MTFKELEDYLQALPRKILEDAAEIVAETATDYFKDSFSRKAFDGNPWASGNAKKTGSLLIDSGALLNSIQPVLISWEKVVIAAGNQKIGYARVHNEGFSGMVNVSAHQRTRKGKTHQVSSFTRNINIPQRQYMGKADELATIIHERLQGHCNTLANTK